MKLEKWNQHFCGFFDTSWEKLKKNLCNTRSNEVNW
jgi:hypothetical protein